jgi:hypothetical protein
MPVAYEWSSKKNFGSFFMAGAIIQAAKMLNQTGRSDKIVLRIILKIYRGISYQDKSNLNPKFFSKISDHQQSVSPAPSRGLPHTPSSAGDR